MITIIRQLISKDSLQEHIFPKPFQWRFGPLFTPFNTFFLKDISIEVFIRTIAIETGNQRSLIDLARSPYINFWGLFDNYVTLKVCIFAPNLPICLCNTLNILNMLLLIFWSFLGQLFTIFNSPRLLFSTHKTLLLLFFQPATLLKIECSKW